MAPLGGAGGSVQGLGRMGEGAGQETGRERQNRELQELLGELRVILPGVQVLFAFLLTLPFTARWGTVTALQRNVYYAALLCTAAATILLIAPSTHHRLLWHRRPRAKEHELRVGSALALAATTLLAAAIAGVVFLVTDVLFPGGPAGVAMATFAGLCGWFWYALPVLQRRQYTADGAAGDQPGD